MAKVTVHEEAPAASPSEQLVQAAIKEEVITAANGLRLSIRKPGVLAQYRLIEALGDLASNSTYMQMVNPLLYLGAIDGDPVILPANKLEVEALIQRLDDDGLGSLMAWYMVNVIQPTVDTVQAAQKQAQDKAAIKN